MHSSGRVLPVGIAHPLKVDHTMDTAEVDSEQEEYEDLLKGSATKDTNLQKHYGNHGSSSKEDQSSDDNEEQNASSSADSSDSSSSSSDEDGNSQQEIRHKDTYKRENRDKDLMEPIHIKPRPTMKSPYMGYSAGQSQPYSKSSKFVLFGHLF